jgi:hypothetical protein
MRFPAFFDDVPKLLVHDPLTELLGCAEGGILEYSYADAVRLVGHSCPTVAAAYWLTWLALHALYPDALPQRGGIKVEMREDARAGSTGVVATVVQMLTGAAGGTGFKGIAGRHARVGLQRYSPGLPLSMRFTRLDTGAAVDAGVDLSLVPGDAALEPLLDSAAHGHADAQALAQLGRDWQERVRHLLLEHGRDGGVFIVRPVARGPMPMPARTAFKPPRPAGVPDTGEGNRRR